MLISLNNSKPIIIIDSGYYVFYRYFATYKWYMFQKKEFTEEEFNKSFIKHMEADIKKITKKWKTDISNVIFGIDCPRAKIWRNDIFSEYKATRTRNINFNQNIFKIFYDYIENKNILKLCLDRFEADDIIYLIYNKLKTISKQKKIIITNDNDYLQLIDDSTSIYNMQFKNIKDRGFNNGRINLYYKSLIGDKSDNIQKISSIITKELAIEISSMNENEMYSWLKDKDLLDKFNFNMKLISFDEIPVEYIEKFNNIYNFTCV